MSSRTRLLGSESFALAAACVFAAGCMSRSYEPEASLAPGLAAGWASATPQEGEQESDPLPMDEGDAPADDPAADGSAGSNPLAAVSKIDLIWQHIDMETSGDNIEDYSVKGSTMLLPRLKLNFEAHYWNSNLTGEDEDDWASVSLKPIWFVKDRALGDVWGMRTALGIEYIADFDNTDKGIGDGTDQIGPLIGFAFMNRESKTVLIPLLQHFEDVGSGPEVSTTALRVIALQPFPDDFWAKADIKLPYDWENEEWPVNGELEAGKMFNTNVGLFLQGLAGVGSDRPFDWGTGIGLRVNF